MLVCSVGFVTVVNFVPVPVFVFTIVVAAVTGCGICCLVTVFILRLVTPCGVVVAEHYVTRLLPYKSAVN